MSAFVCSDETISSLIDVVSHHEEVHDKDLLARRLYLLNVESVKQCYNLKEDSPAEYDAYLDHAAVIKYEPQPDRHPAQNVKAARCWLYQSCEGDCVRAPLYRAIEKIVDAESLRVASDITGRQVSVLARAREIIDSYISNNNLGNPLD